MAFYFDTPIQFLKGVGPKLGAILRRKGFHTFEDVLENYPRSYEDRRAARDIASLRADETVSLFAEVVGVSSYNLGKTRKKIYDVSLRDNSGLVHCKFFRVPYRGYFERFRPGMNVRVVGKVTNYRGRIEFHHPDIHDTATEEELKDQLVPIYSETESMTSSRWQKVVERATDFLKQGEIRGVEEKFPKWLLNKYELPSRKDTILSIHSPPKGAGEDYLTYRSPYHRRIIFEEFFWLEMILAAKKQGVQKDKAPSFRAGVKLARKLEESLPFELTSDQKKVFLEISKDLAKPYPMHRLVQGDVGSGKTLVALMSALVAIESGFQVALMVPTEILAQQHLAGAVKFFEPLGVRVGLLSGHLKAKDKKEINEKLVRGELDLVVGTHALIQKDVEFKKLGLVIVDEQHRFGVEQRVSLKQKGESPHFLLMTATPIPRSLAMTVYGDLDISQIKEMPKGRVPIVTRVTYQSRRDKIVGFVRDHIEKGRQAYVVFPLVEESEKIELSNAIDEHKKLQEELPGLRIGLVHGKMKSNEKDEVMTRFRDHEYDVLVATTVIEVGVDVANANIIWIDHAERFGLSQLHQLRGRVGRGSHKSYCVLSLGFAVSKESKARVQLMEQTSDGFKIAEADLEIRGPGEFLGARQSGLPGFKMANLVRDLEILKEAREAAFAVLKRDPELTDSENSFLKTELDRKKQILG